VLSGKVRNLHNITFGWESLQSIVASVLFKKIKINISQSCLACWSQLMKCMSVFCLNDELYP